MATSQPAAPTPNGYGGGLRIAVRLDGDVAPAHGQVSETGSLSPCRSLAALQWGYCRSVARHPREQGGHYSSSQDMPRVRWLFRRSGEMGDRVYRLDASFH
ncbi:unnamed protein product [Miscanthus lutarioriparius]|uniref:Uncharacterized protein n=1 Tax=Miscanthus lutarioriparius TaxID=422564 RepID=A0A811QSQ1_9POAL|nr:unnamed protein product [Miscanthus lutarioriparius]